MRKILLILFCAIWGTINILGEELSLQEHYEAMDEALRYLKGKPVTEKVIRNSKDPKLKESNNDFYDGFRVITYVLTIGNDKEKEDAMFYIKKLISNGADYIVEIPGQSRTIDQLFSFFIDEYMKKSVESKDEKYDFLEQFLSEEDYPVEYGVFPILEYLTAEEPEYAYKRLLKLFYKITPEDSDPTNYFIMSCLLGRDEIRDITLRNQDFVGYLERLMKDTGTISLRRYMAMSALLGMEKRTDFKTSTYRDYIYNNVWKNPNESDKVKEYVKQFFVKIYEDPEMVRSLIDKAYKKIGKSPEDFKDKDDYFEFLVQMSHLSTSLDSVGYSGLAHLLLKIARIGTDESIDFISKIIYSGADENKSFGNSNITKIDKGTSTSRYNLIEDLGYSNNVKALNILVDIYDNYSYENSEYMKGVILRALSYMTIDEALPFTKRAYDNYNPNTQGLWENNEILIKKRLNIK